MTKIAKATLFAFTLLSLGSLSVHPAFAQSLTATIDIFTQNDIQFDPNDSTDYETASVKPVDNGREIYTSVTLPSYNDDVRITAHLTVHPIPKDEIVVHDKWDRAGNVRLSAEGMADIEIIKYITAYGGLTEYEVDVSHLAPVLKGDCTFKAFIDTWVSPAWKIDFSLEFEPIADSSGEEVYIDYILNPDWAEGIMFVESYSAEKHGEKGVTCDVIIPRDMKRVVMNYFVSGHCTDGSGADEFVPKDNVIFVDGRPVFRFQPWRDDCIDFRAVNPYTRRWSEGYWSSDFSRSGWCPGDKVDPVQIDLTDYLTPGSHTIRFEIENVRPKDDNDHYGYWRLSSHLLGWEKKVNLVKWKM
ncbi:MAG: hypothetical protein GY841_01845 [FCB group bacterium]|nr:hypothetical protein [FCB group bacterium]